MRVFVVLFVLAASPVLADAWQLQDASTFTFTAHFESEALEGRFTDFEVALEFDALHATESSLQVTVYLGGADMGDPDMNDAIAAPEWFDVDGFPQARFESNEIAVLSPGSFVAKGELVLKGEQTNVDVPFAWSESGDLATMRGEFVLERNDFDIGSGEWASGEQIGNEVMLRFDLRFRRAN